MATKEFELNELNPVSYKGVAGKEDENGNVTLIPSGAVFPNQLKSTKFRRVLVHSFDKKLKKSDILFNTGGTGTLGRCGFFDMNQEVVYMPDSFVMVLRFNHPRIHPKYVFYMLRTNDVQSQILKKTSGTTGITSIKPKDILSIRIAVPVDGSGKPDYKEQEVIVRLLEEAETLIQRREEADQKMTTVIPALFNTILNQKDWPIVKLGEVSSVKIGPFGTQLHAYDYVANGVPIVNPTHIVNGRIEIDSRFTVSSHKMKELSQYIMRAGDVVLARRGEMGRCALVTQKEEGYLCGTGSLFITPSKNINPLFLSTLLSSQSIRKQLEESARGVTMKNLNINVVENLRIPLPPIKLQNEYSENIGEIRNLEKKQRVSATNINELFSSLMSQSLTK